MQTEYVRNLNCNYERVLLDEKPQEKRYQYCILSRGGIKGLLPCSLRFINGQSYLYYDISSKQNIAQLYGARCIDREWVQDFLWSYGRIRQELERFLLDAGNVLWYPEQIFQDLENNVFSFLYIPYYKGENGFGKLLEFVADHMDYSDEALADCVYHMYDQLEKNGEIYLNTQIFEDAKCLETSAPPAEENKIEEPTVSGQKDNIIQNTVEETAKDKKERSLFGIFDGRKKKEKEARAGYRQSMQYAMEGYELRAVAEESRYEEEIGQTVFVEEKPEPEKLIRRLYTPEGKMLAVIDKSPVTVGKKKNEADIVLEDASVSRLHARIIRENERYYIEDLNATNGTFKNGLRLQPYEKRELEEGDEIRFGRKALVFR